VDLTKIAFKNKYNRYKRKTLANIYLRHIFLFGFYDQQKENTPFIKKIKII
jgi:hypothetical protein